jgi:hypothetical protein
MAPPNDDRVIIEFIQMGAYVKVSAIDPNTGDEVSIVGDPMRGEAALKQLAAKKLRFVQQKKKEKGGRF